MYPIMKHLVMTPAFLSLFSFALRGLWMMRQAPLLHQRWVNIAPHIIDTLMLVTALILAGILRYNPGAHPWLMAKIIALVVYIVLGVIAFRHANATVRVASWGAAMSPVTRSISCACSTTA